MEHAGKVTTDVKQLVLPQNLPFSARSNDGGRISASTYKNPSYRSHFSSLFPVMQLCKGGAAAGGGGSGMAEEHKEAEAEDVEDVDEVGLDATQKERNRAIRRAVAARSHDTAQWDGAKTRTQGHLVIESWNTQGTYYKALSVFRHMRAPDVLLVQEDGPAPLEGAPDEHTAVQTGSAEVTAINTQYGADDPRSKVNRTVHFAHVTTGSKNLSILSLHPIHNPHLINAAPRVEGSWRFRPALAAQIQGMNIVNTHMVSGAHKLAAKHLSNLMEASAGKASTFIAGDMNMDTDLFAATASGTGEAMGRDPDNTAILGAEKPTHTGGGRLDHGVLMSGGDIDAVDQNILYPKGSDHFIRRYHFKFKGG